MSEVINIYCDESCHLEHDHQNAMVLGAIWCLQDKTRIVFENIRKIKGRYKLSSNFEIKWTKVSPGKVDFYLNIINYFFDNDDLHFRALIIPDKSIINHELHDQTHDDWYYKMYFNMLKVIIHPKYCHHIYLDIKDTRGSTKIGELQRVLANAHYDFARTIIERMQIVRSHEVELLQVADLFIGALSYLNRDLAGNSAKEAIIKRIQERSGYTLRETTLYRENKVNLLRWNPREAE